jgi:hypothetical protein
MRQHRLQPAGAAVQPPDYHSRQHELIAVSSFAKLQTLGKKLHTDGDRIQRDIEEYAELNQQVMQLTAIIFDSVKKLPEVRKS